MKLHHLRADAHVITPIDGADIEAPGDGDFDVADETLARSLLAQPDNYAPADDESRALLEQSVEAQSLAETVGDLHVSDVLPLLDALDPGELADVRAAEEAGKARVTVLSRIDELLAPASEEA